VSLGAFHVEESGKGAESLLKSGFKKDQLALPSSNRNLCGIPPADLNSWEQHFAQVLDHDQSGAVTCWHRTGKTWRDRSGRNFD
jgi:beta-lactamase superfamily II metal-dependent hydrolase